MCFFKKLRLPSERSTVIASEVSEMEPCRVFFKSLSSVHEVHGDRLSGLRNGARSSFGKNLAPPSVHEFHGDRLLGSRNGARARF